MFGSVQIVLHAKGETDLLAVCVGNMLRRSITSIDWEHMFGQERRPRAFLSPSSSLSYSVR